MNISTNERRVVDWVLSVVCIAVITVAMFFHRRTGACGTAHYMFFQLLGGMFIEIITSIATLEYERTVEQAAAALFNATVFCLLLRYWYSKAPSRWYALGLLSLTALYLLSYFYFFPTADCP